MVCTATSICVEDSSARARSSFDTAQSPARFFAQCTRHWSAKYHVARILFHRMLKPLQSSVWDHALFRRRICLVLPCNTGMSVQSGSHTSNLDRAERADLPRHSQSITPGLRVPGVRIDAEVFVPFAAMSFRMSSCLSPMTSQPWSRMHVRAGPGHQMCPLKPPYLPWGPFRQ